MVRRLADQGLLTHEPYRGVRLTAQGRRGALRTLRRHRVIEAYLVQALGYGWDQVHDEAERLEHSASDDLIDRMARAIGEPTVDPHGAPIPSREGAVDETRYATLADLPAGADARVMRVADEDPELLRYLSDIGLTLGSVVQMKERAPYGGPMKLLAGERVVTIGPALAERLNAVVWLPPLTLTTASAPTWSLLIRNVPAPCVVVSCSGAIPACFRNTSSPNWTTS